MSETTYLKLFKHDNPSTNTNQFDVDKALNQNWDKLDDFAGDVNEKVQEIEGNIVEQGQDIAYVKEELETEINELQKDIQANSIIEETEQAKSLYIDDATDSRGKIDVIGNVEQETREGINLWNDTSIENKKISELTGTKVSTSDLKLNKAGKYCFRLFFTDRTYMTTNINIQLKDDTDAVVKTISNISVIELTNEEIARITTGTCWTNQDGLTTNSAKTIKGIMLVNSEELPDDFEQYGASPSINYPSKIATLGSNKNLFNINGTRAEQSTGECSYSDGKITITKAGPIRTIADGLKIGKSYILSWENGNINSIQTVYTSSNTNIDRNYNMNSSTKFIASESTVTVSILNTEVGQYIENLKLEEGEIATTYSPYRTR